MQKCMRRGAVSHDLRHFWTSFLSKNLHFFRRDIYRCQGYADSLTIERWIWDSRFWSLRQGSKSRRWRAGFFCKWCKIRGAWWFIFQFTLTRICLRAKRWRWVLRGDAHFKSKRHWMTVWGAVFWIRYGVSLGQWDHGLKAYLEFFFEKWWCMGETLWTQDQRRKWGCVLLVTKIRAMAVRKWTRCSFVWRKMCGNVRLGKPFAKGFTRSFHLHKRFKEILRISTCSRELSCRGHAKKVSDNKMF